MLHKKTKLNVVPQDETYCSSQMESVARNNADNKR